MENIQLKRSTLVFGLNTMYISGLESKRQLESHIQSTRGPNVKKKKKFGGNSPEAGRIRYARTHSLRQQLELRQLNFFVRLAACAGVLQPRKLVCVCVC